MVIKKDPYVKNHKVINNEFVNILNQSRDNFARWGDGDAVG